MKKLTQKLHIDMETIPVKKMRYKSADDWFDPTKKGDNILLRIQTIDVKNTDYEFLVLMHSLVEAYLCFRRGIKDKEVTEFDLKHINHDNPGDLEDAPYHKEHMTATDVEAILATELDIDWIKYEETLNEALSKKK